ncbi:MAG: porphobilinogen synthase [Flavobacteriaceae bacterium]|nr:porphobilinogen synthase [Flavobacteriaceae bacterium]
MYPLNRNRRLRSSSSMRNLLQEYHLTPNDFIVPLFVVEGKKLKEAIPSMPGYFRLSLDLIASKAVSLWKQDLKAVLLFVKVAQELKDNTGNEAINPNGLMQKAIKTIKNAVPEMIVMTDVALDPYSSFGHDGIVKEGKIVNDPTLAVLSEMALSHAQAGADVIAPSDMMDGRVLAIRNQLEEAHFHDTIIMSYSAKYASAFYGPFRDALDSAPGFGDKKTYQMDFGNRGEALIEIQHDIKEGADIIMVKPGLAYLDIIRDLKNTIQTPIAAYQVSGEYAMLKAASAQGWVDHDQLMLEQLLCFKRAGAQLIATYFAEEAVKLI